MSDSLINKVAESGLISIDLASFLPNDTVVVFDIKPYLFMELILKEKEFRASLAEIDWKEWQKVNNILFELLGEYCGKPADVVMNDATRDFWLNAEDALAYGIIDTIVKRNK